MPQRAIKLGVHTLRMLVVLAIAGILFTGFLFWQISKKPIDLGFAREAIEAALYDSETGHSVRLDRVILFWPDYTGPLLLGLEKAKVVNKAGEVVLSIDEAAMSFSRSALLVGKLRPKTIILKKPKLRAARNADGHIDIGFGTMGGAAAGQDEDGIMARILGYLARPGHEAAKNSIISRLEAFEIEDAQVAIDDKKFESTWLLPHFTAGFFSTEKGLTANFEASMDDVDAKKSSAMVTLDYLWDTKTSKISADLNNIDTKMLLGKLHELDLLKNQNIIFNAHLNAALDESFIPTSLSFDLKSGKGEIFHSSLSDAAIPYSDLSASVIYDTASSTFILDNTNVTLGGVTVRAKGDIKSEGGKILAPVKLEIYDVAQEQIGPLWPVVLKGDNAEEWIVRKMSGGRFQDVWVGLDVEAINAPETGWQVDAKNIQAGFAFKDMNLDYRAPLHSLSKANGSGTFDVSKDEMKITVTDGLLGKLNVKGADLLFDRLVEPGVGDVTMHTTLDGGLQDVMLYLAEEPIHINKELKMNLVKVKGSADLTVDMVFPTRKDIHLKDFKIGVQGTLKNVFLPGVVKDLDLSGGPLEAVVKDGMFTLKGKAMLDQRDVTMEYSEYLQAEGQPFKSKIKASLIADPNIRTRLGIDVSTFIEGSVPVNVEYTSLQDGTAKALVDIDATPAMFFVDPFDFQKSSGTKGSAKLTAHFKDKEIQKITDLTASGEGFDLGDSTITFAHKGKETLLSGGKISRFTLGETKGKLDFEINKDRVAKIVLTASFLDARPFMDAEEAKGEYNELPMMVSVTASSMRTADKEIVKAAQIFVDIDSKGRFNQMEMDAIAGASAVYLRYSPDETGKRTFRLKTDDAGAALRSFQVYSNIRGGEMVIYGEPVGGVLDRNLIGKAQITNFKAVKAPILTKLLSLISVPGLLEAVSSDGLNFSKLEADFNWNYQKGGSVLVLKEGRTSGNSLGLTFDGTFDNANRKIDVKGTVVPMSEVNNLLGNIPLVGDILTGGSGGIFAATYSIKGSSENPEIGINPLSVLTPGILRRILFE